MSSSEVVIRPFAEIRRAEVMAYLAELRFPFRVDRSNFEGKYRRNRIRHELLPVLERIVETDPVAALNEQTDLLALDANYLETKAAEACGLAQHGQSEIRLAIELLRRYHPSLQVRALRRLALELGASAGRETSRRLIELVDRQPGRRVELGHGVIVERGRDSIWFYRDSDALSPVAVACPGATSLPDGTFLIAKVANGDVGYPDGTHSARMLLPNDAELRVRAVRAGDRMSPFGMKETRLVFDILADAGVPRHRRGHTWVLTANDVIYWVLGLRMAEHGRVIEPAPGIYEFTWCSDTN